MQKTFMDIEDLSVHFNSGRSSLKAIQNIHLKILANETLGLVGESGCGKSTFGRTLLGLHRPASGKILIEGQNLAELSEKEWKGWRRHLQMIFQNPYASLNPRMNVQEIIGEALDIHKLAKGAKRKERISQLMHLVGLHPQHMLRYPHEFSGGQRQRIGIARALAVEPRFIVCDEPISALDVSIQAQIVNLLKKLQQSMNLTYLFIAHDLAMVKYLSDRVAVMYLGQLMELSATDDLFSNPLHPYTKALLSSIPIPDPFIEKKRQRIILKGEISNPLTVHQGCPFASRCPHAVALCVKNKPLWREYQPGHFAACHFIIP